MVSSTEYIHTYILVLRIGILVGYLGRLGFGEFYEVYVLHVLSSVWRIVLAWWGFHRLQLVCLCGGIFEARL